MAQGGAAAARQLRQAPHRGRVAFVAFGAEAGAGGGAGGGHRGSAGQKLLMWVKQWFIPLLPQIYHYYPLLPIYTILPYHHLFGHGL